MAEQTYRYYLFYKDDSRFRVDTTITPTDMETNLIDKKVVKIGDSLYDFNNIVRIEMKKLVYVVDDSKDGGPVILSNIIESNRQNYIREERLDYEEPTAETGETGISE